MSNRLLLLGGGGHCKSIIDSLLTLSNFDEIGIIEKDYEKGKSILGIPIIGNDDDLERLFNEGFAYAFISLGSIGDASRRKNLFDLLNNIGFIIPNIIDQSARVSAKASFGKGIFIGKNVVINIESNLGDCSIVNTSSTIEHGCQIGEFSHIAPGSVLCGEVKIGNNTHIGANSVIKQQVTIGSNVMIGMGSVVLQDIPANSIAYGNPCKKVGIQ